MTVTDAAILSIREMITTGALRPGDRLPPEKELSERLNLSRNSLREAVKALVAIRVLDVRRGDGTYVTSLEPGVLLEALSFVVDLHGDRSVLEIFAVRRILEPAAAALAAQRMDAQTIDRLEALLRGTPADSDVAEIVRSDVAFHQTIVEAAGNEYLSRLVESMTGDTVRARLWRGITQDGAATRTIDEHSSILTALKNGDPQLAEALMLAHIAGIEEWLRQSL